MVSGSKAYTFLLSTTCPCYGAWRLQPNKGGGCHHPRGWQHPGRDEGSDREDGSKAFRDGEGGGIIYSLMRLDPRQSSSLLPTFPLPGPEEPVNPPLPRGGGCGLGPRCHGRPPPPTCMGLKVRVEGGLPTDEKVGLPQRWVGTAPRGPGARGGGVGVALRGPHGGRPGDLRRRRGRVDHRRQRRTQGAPRGSRVLTFTTNERRHWVLFTLAHSL